MRIVMFYHSLVSDWNHGNAHFLRGVVAELQERGVEVSVYEPANGWSRSCLQRFHGDRPLRTFQQRFPTLRSIDYDPATLNLDDALDGADAVIVHEWNHPWFVNRISEHRRNVRSKGSYSLLFHDTHHRVVSSPHEMGLYDLSAFDGVLAFGEVVRHEWLRRGWARAAWTWHEAADTRVYHPLDRRPRTTPTYDVIWVGNWGDEERTEELERFLIRPIADLKLKARFHGVRYPDHALRMLDQAGIEYGGYLPAYAVPDAMHDCRMTVHVPRRPYAERIHGVPTIRVFEALACGTPLLCSPWRDSERLFCSGKDFQIVEDGRAMRRAMERLLGDPEAAREQAARGLTTIRQRHTCGHRVDEFLIVLEELSCSRRHEVVRDREAGGRRDVIPRTESVIRQVAHVGSASRSACEPVRGVSSPATGAGHVKENVDATN